jgi:hypothetical protein
MRADACMSVLTNPLSPSQAFIPSFLLLYSADFLRWLFRQLKHFWKIGFQLQLGMFMESGIAVEITGSGLYRSFQIAKHSAPHVPDIPVSTWQIK